MLPLLIAIFAAVITASLVPVAILLAQRFGFLDQPAPRKVHQLAIPRIGGLAILAGLLGGFVAAVFLSKSSGVDVPDESFKGLLGIALGGIFIAIVGFVDDVRSISSRFKLCALLFTAMLICGAGGSFANVYLFGENYVEFRWLAWLATLLWITGITVSVNFIDGLDGLAAGLVAMAAAVLGGFLLVGGEILFAGFCFALVGALLGFLLYNKHPAKIFMGDCGSMLIGMTIASLMLFANPKIGSMRALLLPSLALSIPILDGTFTFFRRHYLQRRSIFSAERGHIHHRLLDRGVRHHHAVWFLYLVSAAAVCIGIFAVSLDGWQTLAGLAPIIPLLWGAFRFAGSVRTNEMLKALRAKRSIDKHSKLSRNLFESMQLEFDKIQSFAGWWQGVCRACEQLDFVNITLTIGTSDKPRQLSWTNPRADLCVLPMIRATIPIPDSAQHGGCAQAEVSIAVTQTPELASGRLALFARLTTEHSVAEVRKRENSARSKISRVDAAQGRRARLPLGELEGSSQQDSGVFGHLRIAIVHDFFYTYCGAERVVEQLINVFPHCDIYSLFDFLPESQRGFLRGKHVTTSLIQRLPFASSKHRAYLPLMPFAIEQLDVSNYDVVISSSYLAAKGVITGPDQLHVCYCHSPVRYAWDLQHQYLRESNLGFGPKGLLARTVLHYVRTWDVRSSLSVDHFIANSQFVARRILKLYRRDATVIHPPVDTDQFEVNAGLREEFYLVVGRMVPYKRTDLIVKAFSRTPHRKLVIIGDGPEMDKVKQLAGENVTCLGFQENEVLTDYMRRAKALIFAAEEDFGIVPVEALSCGTPVIAFGKGGVTETVVDGEHGVLFYEQTEESLVEAVNLFEAKSDFGSFLPQDLRAHSLDFSSQVFRDSIESHVKHWTTNKEQVSLPVGPHRSEPGKKMEQAEETIKSVYLTESPQLAPELDSNTTS